LAAAATSRAPIRAWRLAVIRSDGPETAIAALGWPAPSKIGAARLVEPGWTSPAFRP
jgi:hypothetical protein